MPTLVEAVEGRVGEAAGRVVGDGVRGLAVGGAVVHVPALAAQQRRTKVW